MSSSVNSVASYCSPISTSNRSTPSVLHKLDLQQKPEAFKSQVSKLVKLYISAKLEDERVRLESEIVLLTESKTGQNRVLQKFKSKISPIVHPHKLFERQIVRLTKKIDSWASEDDEVVEALLNRAEILLDLGREEEALDDYQKVKMILKVSKAADWGIQKCNRHLHPSKPPSVPETSLEKNALTENEIVFFEL